ncbi:hypothetical protein CEXT_653851 [Caerostris extrusa]|uniref:Uncharacterized protein n=1 Tax=Caerostris extrusa TaxID=172846 RepID=A0AAV4SYH2_CAEEX|nr:hypothetical protein CEXT_653851 [Caerostris extrusa]
MESVVLNFCESRHVSYLLLRYIIWTPLPRETDVLRSLEKYPHPWAPEQMPLIKVTDEDVSYQLKAANKEKVIIDSLIAITKSSPLPQDYIQTIANLEEKKHLVE